MVRPEWDEAGFTNEQSGRLGRPVPSGYVCVPGSIATDGPFLVWKYENAKTYRPSGDVLNQFVRLWKGTTADEEMWTMAGSTDTPTAAETKRAAARKALEARSPHVTKRTLRFARRYGILLLREDRTLALNFEGTEGRELLADWWQFSRQACAFLNIAAALNAGRLGDRMDWSAIDSSVDAKFLAHPERYPELAKEGYLPPHGISAARQRFELVFQNWLQLGRITFGIASNAGKKFEWHTEIDYGGRLFSAITLQLLLTVVNADSVYCCSGCGLPYMRPKKIKKPNPGEANFCPDCGPEEALRQADRRRREKMAEARLLEVGGVPVKEIAQRLETTPASVGRWLKKGKSTNA